MPAVDPSVRNIPLFPPESNWRPPKEPPNLAGVKRLGIDTETCDPGMQTFGPGILHGKAHCVGISLATDDAKWYFPTKHPSDNCDWDVHAWMRDLVKEERDWVGANLPYDMEILDHYGIQPKGRWLDVQVAEPLLDEEKDGGYSLDALAKYYLSTTKNEDLLRHAAAAYGIDPKAELWKLPARFVGPYAEDDASLALKIFDLQRPRLEADEMVPVFDLETELSPLVYEMRKKGVRVNLNRAEELREMWLLKQQGLEVDFAEHLGGLKVDIWSGKQLAQLCESKGIAYRLTDKKNPTFDNDWLAAHEHPMLQIVAGLRLVTKMRRDFLDGSILKYQINGRLHASFHQLRTDDDDGVGGRGTRSGRFSSSQPNLQQIPSRDPYYGPLIRSLFLPEEGELWFSGDFKSQEPRLLVHFAYLLKAPGAAEMVARYLVDPMLDMHQLCADLCVIQKRSAKTIGLGMTYGMGEPKLADSLGLSLADAKVLFGKYHEMMPFVAPTAGMVKKVAERRGYVRTLMGRRSHFKLVGTRREYTHKALNRVLQGSGADMIKKAMLDIWKETSQIPLMSVHDELSYSIMDPSLGALITAIMERALPISVPNKVDALMGMNWSEAHG